MSSASQQIDFAFLDSGTGGIPYMLTLHSQLPQAKCVYLGDTAHFPYGEKSLEEVTKCASMAIRTIVEKWNPKAIVIACNTISVTALSRLRELFPDLPIVGTVPAIKLAAKVTKNKRIGLLATNATVNHPYCQNLIDEFASDCVVIKRGDPKLIDFIEKDFFSVSDEEKLAAVKEAADFFMKENCDTVILGCTHFTHIAEEMKKACGPDVMVVDSRDGVARQAARQVESEEWKVESETRKVESIENLTFFVTSATETEILEYNTLCENMNIPWGGILNM
ncbi:MAG: glutamate racemase [Treponema sp.]|nr:glutamate racemase [Candidatus Treponema equifaecale]